MKALPNTRLLNCYSASETHEIACGDIKAMVNQNQPYCPVGPPLDPKHTYVLDENQKPVDVGVSGELFIGGDLLARGYLNLEETTAKAFLPDPFDNKPGARMYRTGDMARILPSGLMEITGRVGAMIKLRGYSVVPGTVENAIVKNLAVKQCAVVPRGDGVERQLVAYIVHDRESNDDRTVVSIDEAGYCPKGRRALAEHLAHYMVPALWVELDELPTHEVSGKVDLKSLPAPPEPGSVAAPSSKPKADNNTKIRAEQIVELWAASLNIPVTAVTKEHSFFDLGGHSLTLADLSNRLSKTFGFPVPLGSLAGDPTIKGHVDAVTAARDGHTAAVQADLPAVLRADSVLAADIKPKNARMRPLSEAKTVLLTGVTGYLGAFLLSSLLESTTADIVCLVRFESLIDDQCSAGMARLRKNLTDLGLWTDSVIDRVEILPANLSRKRLGLTPDHFEELASRVEVIIHAAATVNLVYPYAALRAPNVGGTREILRLACLAGATVHHVSTNGVLPPSTEGWSEDTIIDVDDVTKLQDGYGQTKWVAEQLVLEAGRRGLPARIYRPGTISGHSKSGATNAWDLLTAMIVESLQIGYAPDIDNWLVEMTPVDFVSKAITTLADHEDMSQRIFHLGDPAPINANDVFSYLSQLGFATEKLAFEKWAALWKQKRGSGRWGEGTFTVDILRSGMPTVDFIQEVTVLNDSKTTPILENVFGLSRPKIDAKLLETYTRHFYARGWLPRPPRKSADMATQIKPKGPLSGKVAVITGASSGIGAAVATALAAEGADVAIAARRVEVLDSLKSKITSTSGVKVLAQATDVTDRSQVEALIKATEETLGPVDVLVACAGVMYYTLMKNVHVDEWERTVDVNCKGLLNSLSSTVPSMLSRGKGHIVAISSDAGRKVFPGLGVYSASKFFVEGTLQALRVETAGSGLRVTSVQPGNTATDLLGMSTDTEAVKKYGEASGAKILDPEDVAGAIVYAVTRPEHVAVNEVLIEPRDEPI